MMTLSGLYLKVCSSNFLNSLEDYNVIYMGYQHLVPEDGIKYLCVPETDLHIRDWMGVISQVDYPVWV